jgi:hypothetical protein
MSGRPWTGREILELRKLAASGVRAREIAAELSRTIEAIRSRAADEAIPLRRRTPAYSEEDISTIKRMARAGHPAASIAHAVGRTPRNVRDKCRELGTPVRRSQSTGGDRVQHGPAVMARARIEARKRGMHPHRLVQMIVEEKMLDKHRTAAVDRALARLECVDDPIKAIALPPAALLFAPQLRGSMS